jgi:hypothetical protein
MVCPSVRMSLTASFVAFEHRVVDPSEPARRIDVEWGSAIVSLFAVVAVYQAVRVCLADVRR